MNTHFNNSHILQSPSAQFSSGYHSKPQLTDEQFDSMIFLSDAEIEKFLDEDDFIERLERGELDAIPVEEPGEEWPVDQPELLELSELVYLMEASRNGGEDL